MPEMPEMHWKRPHHTRWLAACVLAFLLAGRFGGFSVSVGAVFLIIFAVGAVLLNSQETETETETETGAVDETGVGDQGPVADYPDGEDLPDASPTEDDTPRETVTDPGGDDGSTPNTDDEVAGDAPGPGPDTETSTGPDTESESDTAPDEEPKSP